MEWSDVVPLLARWHRDRDPVTGHALFSFLEAELTGVTPRSAAHVGEDALRDVLAEIAEAPLPADIRDARTYLERTVRNRAIDLIRSGQRRAQREIESAEPGTVGVSREPDPANAFADAETRAMLEAEVAQVNRALSRLSIEDRIVFKLNEAQKWLTDEEVQWLASRAGQSPADVHAAIASAERAHDLTRIFDPGDDAPDDSVARRKRMERFRKRRSRIAERLCRLLEEGA